MARGKIFVHVLIKFSDRRDKVDLFLIICLGILLFTGVNLFVYFFARGKTKRMVGTGIVMVLLSPLIFYTTLEFVGLFDKGSGFGAALFAIVYGGLFFLNAVVVLAFSNP